MEFEWDENKRQENIANHGIDFEDAISVFFDSNALMRKILGFTVKDVTVQ
jgi:uncharacterized DUF497 family protein